MDPISLIIGAVVAVGLGVLIYTQRQRLGALQTSVQRGAATTRARLSRSVDSRYRDAVIDLANSWHVAGHLIPLEQIAVLPRFYTLPRPHNPLEEAEETGYDGPLNMLPVTPDWPQALAPYNLPGIPLDRVLRGPDSLALLGLPGSGRTITLALMALLAVRQTEDDQEGGILGEARLPILFHLADLDLSPETWGAEKLDPLLPLLEAARACLRGLASHTVSAIRRPFAAGRGLILIDGWDELPPLKRQQAIEWLRVLMTTYPGNKLVVSGPVRGYSPLQEAGLAPAFVLPWSTTEFAELGQLWAEAWPEIGGTEKAPAPEPDLETVRRALRGSRARSPFDVTLKLWAALAKDDPGQGRRGWYSAYVDRVIPAPELRSALEQVGEALLSTRDETGLPSDEVTALVHTARDALEIKPATSTPDFIYTITNETRLLTERTGNRLSFTQPVVGAYLAAEGLRDEPFHEPLLEDRPLNHLVMTFLAQMQDITPYIEQRLEQRGTVLHDGLLALAEWATDADPEAPWRSDLFKQLAAFIITPAEFPLARERACAALVASRDRNVNFIFLEGLRSSDPRARVLSAIGLGAIGDPEMVTPLGEFAADSDPDVEAAVALALGATGTKPALNYMIQVLLSGTDMARRAVCEMLSMDIASEGHEILRDAAQEQDPATRKAAVYGLERIGEEWAVELLHTAEVRDDQWIVRAAATNALEMLQQPPDDAPRLPPLPEESPWLIEWLAARDIGVAPGPEGIQQLVRALQEGDDALRAAAADTLGALARPEGIMPLYAALRDSHPDVREGAHRALGAISLATGHTLPGVL